MEKGIHKKYLEEIIKGIEKNFSLFVKDQNPEDLHRMRVEVKKANSLLKLQVFAKPKSKVIHFFRPIRKIFKQAGLIREAKLNLENLESIQVQDEKIKQLLQTEVDKETKKYLFKARKFGNQLEKSGAITLKKMKTVPDKKVQAFCRFHLQVVSKNFKRKLYVNYLHESRKSLKLLIHIHEIMPDTSFEALQINWSYFDQLQEKIGIWHDFHRTAYWMKKNKANKISLKTIHSRLQEQLAEIKELKKDFEIKALDLNGIGASPE